MLVIFAGTAIALLSSYVNITGSVTLDEKCGNDVVRTEFGEQCELPDTQNNQFCQQFTGDCLGVKKNVRDTFGNCNSACVCEEDLVDYICVKDECGAECDSNDDCQPTLDSNNNNCLFDWACSTECSCNYQGEFCPAPGTTTDNICYFGTQGCDSDGCTLTTCVLISEEICDPQNGCVTTTTTTSTTTTSSTTTTESTTTTTESTTTTTESTTTTTEPSTTTTTESTTTTTTLAPQSCDDLCFDVGHLDGGTCKFDSNCAGDPAAFNIPLGPSGCPPEQTCCCSD